MAQPSDNEYLEIEDDGSFTMWRSVGWATLPPTPVGQFAGALAAEDLRALRAEADAAAREGDLTSRMQPGIPVETIEAGDATADVTPGREIPGAWGALVDHLRGLLASLTDQPVAALSIEVAGDGRSARLQHLGSEPIRLDLRQVSMLVSRHSAAGASLGEWRLPATDLGGEVEAEDGWTLELPFDHGLDGTPGSRLTVIANLAAYDDEDLRVPVSVAASVES